MLAKEGVIVEGMTFWGTTDNLSWLQSSSNVGGGSDGKGRQFPLLFDDNYEAKPSYWVFVDTDKYKELTTVVVPKEEVKEEPTEAPKDDANTDVNTDGAADTGAKDDNTADNDGSTDVSTDTAATKSDSSVSTAVVLAALVLLIGGGSVVLKKRKTQESKKDK